MKRRHLPWTLPTLLALLVPALWPLPASAACGVQDPGGCVDGAMYSFWAGIAGMGWAADRTLLVLAYQLDTFRWWLVDVAFTSAYQVLVQVIDPLLVPFAMLAVTLGCLALLLLPLIGRTSLVNVRHALVWTLMAPLLLTVSGPAIVQLEQLRAGVGSALFSGVRAIAPGAIFGPSGSDMAVPAMLYPSNPCGGSTLARQSGDGLRVDDLAAALLWADAEDIHCPDAGGPSADMPDRFYEAAPTGPGYATDADINMLDPGNDRTRAVQSIQRGAVRTFLGLLPAALAVLDALVQLVFALCLIALWIGLPIGLLFVFFEQTAGGVTGLLRRFLAVLQVSWSSSVLLGIVAACLISAADLRNAGAYTGFAIGGLVLTGYMLVVAVDTLKGCIRTLNDTVATATGLSITRPVELASELGGSALRTGAAVAAGGVGAAVTATAAMQQTGSGRYALGAAMGRIRPVAQLGEVAAAMGAVGDEELLAGLHVGQRTTQGSWRGTRLQMLADATRSDSAGMTIRDHARERSLERQIARAERPTVVQEIGDAVGVGQAAISYAASAQPAHDLQAAGAFVPEAVGAGWRRVRDGWRELRRDVDLRSGGSNNPMRRTATTIQVLDDRLRPGERGAVMFLDPERQLRYEPPPSELPVRALHERRERVRVPRLLLLGYAVHEHDDGSVSFWQREPESRPPASARKRQSRHVASPGADSPSDDERRLLLQRGALLSTAAVTPVETAQARNTAADESAAAAIGPETKEDRTDV